MNRIPGLILKGLTVLQGETTQREGYGKNQKALERASGGSVEIIWGQAGVSGSTPTNTFSGLGARLPGLRQSLG